jgi:hypothetical protein
VDRAIRSADGGSYVDLVIVRRQVGVPQAVVVLRLGSAEHLPATAATADEEFERLSETRLALTVSGVDHNEWGVECEPPRFRAERSEPADLHPKYSDR